MGVKAFVSKNLIAIVMVPAIIGAHYTWYKLQEDDRLVSRRERERLPLYTENWWIHRLTEKWKKFWE